MGASSSYEIVPQASRVVVITGANTGLGFETAKVIANEGAQVIMACRSKERGEAAMQKVIEFVKEESDKEANVELMLVDLGSQKSIRQFAQEFREKGIQLNTLINNAGIMALPERELTEDGFEKQWGVNHFGPFTLTMLLLDIIEESDAPRIVNLASTAHKAARRKDFQEDNWLMEGDKYDAWASYGRSKMSNIYFTQALNTYLRERNSKIMTNCVHPGVVATELGRNMDMPAWVMSTAAVFLKKPEDGAKTQIKAALAEEWSETTGQYLADESISSTNSLAQDKEIEGLVWQISQQLCGLKEVSDGKWEYVDEEDKQEENEVVVTSELDESEEK